MITITVWLIYHQSENNFYYKKTSNKKLFSDINQTVIYIILSVCMLTVNALILLAHLYLTTLIYFTPNQDKNVVL